MGKVVSHRPVISLQDYLRIFRVMHAVMEGVGSDGTKCCLFFSVAGAAILRHFYKKEATVVAGSAFYLLDDATSAVLAITKFADGQLDQGIVESDRGAFHCWIECEGQIIDFQAPVFRESLRESGIDVRVPRKMLQKPRSLMSSAHGSLEQVGDFHLRPNLALTNQLVPGFFTRPANTDLLSICMTWFTRPPKRIADTFAMQNDLGQRYDLRLSEIGLVGGW